MEKKNNIIFSIKYWLLTRSDNVYFKGKFPFFSSADFNWFQCFLLLWSKKSFRLEERQIQIQVYLYLLTEMMGLIVKVLLYCIVICYQKDASPEPIPQAGISVSSVQPLIKNAILTSISRLSQHCNVQMNRSFVWAAINANEVTNITCVARLVNPREWMNGTWLTRR